jgi:ABC-type molybdate transport system substrate-binding protein
LANLALSAKADLFMPKDNSYLQIARKRGMVKEIIPVAHLRVVLAVRKGNPKNITTLDSLMRAGLKVAASDARQEVGRVTREALKQAGKWDALEKHILFNPIVNGIANDLVVGTVDAGFIWDCKLGNFPELEVVPAPALSNARGLASIGVMRKSAQPTAALRFARYLAAFDKGLKEFARQNLLPVHGDDWAEVPEVVLYSGAMHRWPVEKTIKRFAEREGVRIARVYNETTNLVAQMKAGRRPDAFLAGDKLFLEPVAELFLKPAFELSDCELILLVHKGNPKGIRSLADLAQGGLRVGLANPGQSTLGACSRRVLEKEGVWTPVQSNAVVNANGDALVSQLRNGSVDAALVFNTLTAKVSNQLELVRLSVPGAVAIQTLSISRDTKYRYLLERLAEALRSEESRALYQAAGFRGRTPGPATPGGGAL